VYKLNPVFIYSQPSEDIIKIISLEDANNSVYTIKGASAQVFKLLVDGHSLESIEQTICALPGAPSKDKTHEFLLQFIQDLQQLHFIELS
jgi:hypothetical protein